MAEQQENNLVEINLDEMEFTIPIQGLSYVEDALEKLNKRAKRLKMEPMELVKLGTKKTTYKKKFDIYLHAGMKTDKYEMVDIPVTLITLRIKGNPPKLPGYKLIARLDWKEGSPFIAEVPGEDTPVKYRTVQQGCDHCNKNARRNDTFVLQNTNTGEYVQIGRTCLADFLGHKDKARDIVNSMQFFKDVRDWLTSLYGEFAGFGENDEDDPMMRPGGGGGGFSSTTMDDFLPLVIHFANKNGYRSAAQARDNPGTYSTGDDAIEVLSTLHSPGRIWGQKERKAMEDAAKILNDAVEKHTETAKKMLAKVVEVYEKDPDKASTYLFNLYNIAKQGMDAVLGEKKWGLAASIYQFYKRQLEQEDKAKERETQRDKARAESGWVGEVKKRMRLKVKVSRPSVGFDTMYGYMTIMFFADENGNQFTWKTSSPFDANPGEWLDIDATVKEHGEYKGIKQTVLTRVKIINDHSEEEKKESYHESGAYTIEKDGGKIVAWHGTKGVFDDKLTANRAGQNDWGFYGKGIYFANSEPVATGYALAGNGMLIKAILDLKNPFIMDTRTHKVRQESAKKLREMGASLDSAGYVRNKEDAAKLTDVLKKHGHDGMIVYGQGIEYVVFDHGQVEEISRKQVDNPGVQENLAWSEAPLTLQELRTMASPTP